MLGKEIVLIVSVRKSIRFNVSIEIHFIFEVKLSTLFTSVWYTCKPTHLFTSVAGKYSYHTCVRFEYLKYCVCFWS